MINIYTGEESDDKTNVHEAKQIGEAEMKKFKEKLPEGFRERLSTNVKTMSSPKVTKKELPLFPCHVLVRK